MLNTDRSIRGYGVVLYPVLKEDLSSIEKLRLIRNYSENRTKLFNTSYVEKEDQIRWFQSLPEHKLFLLIYPENHQEIKDDNDDLLGQCMGYCQINEYENHYELGCVLTPENHATLVPYQFSLALLDFLFKHDDESYMMCEVAPQNIPALNFNLSLGYRILNSEISKITLKLIKEDYISASKRIKTMLSKC